MRTILISSQSHRDHVKELNNVRPKQPFFFLKPPTTLLYPGQGNVIRPKGVNLHYEIELALIIGKKITDLDPTDEKGALDAIDSMILFRNSKIVPIIISLADQPRRLRSVH